MRNVINIIKDFIKKKIQSFKIWMLKSMGIEPEDTRTPEERTMEFLKNEYELAQKEYKYALAYYNEAEPICVDYAIKHLDACRSKIDCIVRQMKEFEEWNNYDK